MNTKELICFKCKYLNEDSSGCAAFDEIPESITSGINKHNKPLRGQKNKIVFKLKKES